MLLQNHLNPRRSGISLTEILIGIMVLGIGVISLATLFPIGLLRMKRAVNDVRGTVEARSGLNEVRVRNLLAPPYGPWFSYPPAAPNPLLFSPFSADPGGLTGFPAPPGAPFRPTTGPGITVVIDPLWMIQNPNVVPGTPETYRFGLCDLGNPPNGVADFYGGEGFYRTGGGIQ